MSCTIMLYAYCKILFSIPVPNPLVSITHSGGNGTLYSGSQLTLTCTIIPVGVNQDNIVVSSNWTRDGHSISSNGRLSISDPLPTGGIIYTTTLSFNTLYSSDNGDYACHIQMNPRSTSFALAGQNSSTIGIGSIESESPRL